MGLQKLALPFALACFLLAGPFLMAEAARSRCKQQQQVRERKPTFEILHWQEACLPLAVVLGGCCGLVWWLFLAICSACQKGGQNGLPQVLCEVEPEERKTTTLICQEEWTDAGDELDGKGPGTGNEYRHVEFESRPPSPPKEQGNTPIWSYLEQELGKILLAIRSHRTAGQSPMVEEVMSPPPVEKPNNLAADWQNVQAAMTQQPLMVAGPRPPAVEQPNNMAADWQNFLAQMKQQYPLMVAGPSSPAVDKQQPLTGEGPSPQAVDKPQPLTGERPSPGAVENQNPPSGKGQSSPHKEKKKTPNRPRSRSKTKSHTSPSSRNQGFSLGRKGRSCRDY